MEKAIHWLANKHLLKLLYLLPLAVYSIPKEFWFEGRSFCLFKNLFGYACYGCGITRAVVSLLYLDPQAAWGYHPCAFIVLPLLIYVWIRYVRRIISKK